MDWHIHNGGECPVPPEQCVDVRWNNGAISAGNPAWLWTGEGGRGGEDFWRGVPGCRIVAYR